MIVSMCDLTTLEGEDTEGKVSQMVAKAIIPDPNDLDIKNVAAVCVYPSLVSIAKEKIGNSSVKVAAVSSYFPSGQVPMESKLLDTKYAIDSGADKIAKNILIQFPHLVKSFFQKLSYLMKKMWIKLSNLHKWDLKNGQIQHHMRDQNICLS